MSNNIAILQNFIDLEFDIYVNILMIFMCMYDNTVIIQNSISSEFNTYFNILLNV